MKIFHFFTTAQWYVECEPQLLQCHIDGSVEALLRHIVLMYGSDRERIALRRQVSAFVTMNVDLNYIIMDMRFLLLKLQLLDPLYEPSLLEVIDSVERVSGPNVRDFLRMVNIELPYRQACTDNVTSEQYFKSMSRHFATLSGLQWNDLERQFLDLDRLSGGVVYPSSSPSLVTPSFPIQTPAAPVVPYSAPDPTPMDWTAVINALSAQMKGTKVHGGSKPACKFFASGNCTWGEKCRFTHDTHAPKDMDREAKGIRCFACSGFGHIASECANTLKHSKN